MKPTDKKSESIESTLTAIIIISNTFNAMSQAALRLARDEHV